MAISNIIAVIAIVYFILQPFRAEPPTPAVSAGETSIPTTQGSFCWDGILRAQCVDKVYTSVLDMGKEHQPTVVSQNEKIKVKFNKQPGALEVEQWVGEEQIEKVEVKDQYIVVPKDEGVYVYHILANWKRGNGNYVFSVEVK
ncbi:hypothetical protein [Rossellomorea sp. NRS-1567]|uniref:hypothetical protein n=1 Tax=Rossellomorea sp. NRS-1567 TaxID=3233901 RepID=UPI003D29D0DD